MIIYYIVNQPFLKAEVDWAFAKMSPFCLPSLLASLSVLPTSLFLNKHEWGREQGQWYMEFPCHYEQSMNEWLFYCWNNHPVNILVIIKTDVIQPLSRVQLFATPWIAACQASLPITNSRRLLKLLSIESVTPSSHLILCLPLLLLPPIPPSIRVFSNKSTLCMRWPKYCSFSFSISPSNVYPGLISFRMDWFNLLAVQGTLKRLLQHRSSKASIFRHSAFFIVQLSHPYMTTGKTIALTRWTFIGKVMSLLFNVLSKLVTTFLPRSKRLLIIAE